jgi:predicted nuclease of predicted toxin-antitoxin system
MNILANENLYEPMIEFLRSEGHNVISVRDCGLSGALDDVIYEKAVREQLLIVTMDKDFSRLMRFPPERCAGIIVAKLYRMPVDETTQVFMRYFKSLDENRIKGRLVIMTRDGVRLKASREPR